MTRISIVTISLNQAKYIERALRSVLEQDYRDVEYIVVDPGSSDGSREIIEGYRPRISRIIFEPDTGPAGGLNKGFAAATGDIFGYINADDAYLPGAIRKAMAAFRDNPEADVVYGHAYIVDGYGRIVRRSRSVPFNLRLYAYGGVTVMQQSTFFRRVAFEKAGGFNATNRTSWDGELLVDLARSGCQFTPVDDYWSLFAVYQGSITSGVRHNRQFHDDHARIFRTIVGRNYEPADQLRFLLARMEKWFRNPRVPIERMVDCMINRNKRRFSGASHFASTLTSL